MHTLRSQMCRVPMANLRGANLRGVRAIEAARGGASPGLAQASSRLRNVAQPVTSSLSQALGQNRGGFTSLMAYRMRAQAREGWGEQEDCRVAATSDHLSSMITVSAPEEQSPDQKAAADHLTLALRSSEQSGDMVPALTALVSYTAAMTDRAGQLPAPAAAEVKAVLQKLSRLAAQPVTVSHNSAETRPMTLAEQLNFTAKTGVVTFGVISLWRGVWFMWDGMVLPEDPLTSGLASAAVGLGVLLGAGALNVALAPPLTQMTMPVSHATPARPEIKRADSAANTWQENVGHQDQAPGEVGGAGSEGTCDAKINQIHQQKPNHQHKSLRQR